VAEYSGGKDIVYRGSETGNWQIRGFPNLFADVVPDPLSSSLEWITLPGHGYHEVIVDSPNHWDNPSDFSKDHLALVLEVYRDRYLKYSSKVEVKYISIFKNKGKDAGASLNHTHSQIVALPIIPPAISSEMAVLSSSSFCLYCNIMDREKVSKRFILENDNWILIAPFYSIAPYETWILSKGHLSNLGNINKEQLQDLAAMLQEDLKRTKALLDDPDYNFMIYQLPSNYHLNIRIHPALTKITGFEKSTRVYINPVPPEQAAEELRNS
jgi:UDPglucose--hexose-1-phosphate uridylyltransferase